MLAIPQPLRILIYADQMSRVEFSHPERSEIIADFKRYFGSKIEIIPVSAKDVRQGDVFNWGAHVFILPGIIGEKSFYPDHIGPQGNAHIQTFVQKGGVFLGYCAGAYYATSHVLYKTMDNETKIRERHENLSLTAARSFGPLPGYCRPDPETMKYSQEWHRLDPITIELDDGTQLNMAYGLGPVFNIASDCDVTVRARYAHIEGKPPAIIDGQYGDGFFMLYGALPQFSASAAPTNKGNKPTRVLDLLSALYESRREREAFADTTMRRIAQHCRLAFV